MYKETNIGELFENIFQKLSSPTFGEGLGGELPIFIQPTPIKQQDEIDAQVPLLIKRLNEANHPTLEIDFYDLCLELLEENDTLSIILESEKETDREILIETLDSIIDIDEVLEKITQTINESPINPSIILFTGVGHAYPIMRSHTVLNNIQGLAGKKHIVLLFPGSYDNQQLALFDIIHDENYYRAQNLNNLTR